MKKINAFLLFVIVLTACVSQPSLVTSAPQFTETIVTETITPDVTPQPTASPTATLIPATETKLSKDTFLFPCDSNQANVIPLKKDTSLTLLGSYGEMAVVTAYADKSEICGLVALTSLENKPSKPVSPELFSTSEPVNAIPFFKSSEDYPRLTVKNDQKFTIDNTVESDTKDGYYLVFNNDEPISTERPFMVSLRFDSKDIGGITTFGKPRDWNKDWWQDVTFLEIACNDNQCDVSFFDGTSEDSQSLISFENNPDLPVQVLFQDPLGNELDLIFPDGTSEHFKLHAPLFPDSKMEVGAQAGPNSKLEVNEYKIQQVPPSRALQVITPENAANVQLQATWGRGTPWVISSNSNNYFSNFINENLPIQAADDGKIFVIQSVTGVYLYSAISGDLLYSMTDVLISQVSEDGKLLATGHTDAAVKVWNIVDQKLIGEYSAGDYVPDPQSWDKYKRCQNRKEFPSPTVLRFSHDGSLIAAGYCDGVTGVWDVHNRNGMSLVWPAFLGLGDFKFSKNDQYFSISKGFWLYKLNKDAVDGAPKLHGDFQDFDISPNGEKIAKIYCKEKECKILIAPLQNDQKIQRNFSIDKGETSPKITYSKDGQYIVADFPTSGERLTLDANTGQIAETITIPTPPELPDFHWLIERGHIDGVEKVGVTGLFNGLQGEGFFSNDLAWGTTGKEIFWWNIANDTVKFYPQEVSKIVETVPQVIEDQSIFFSPNGSQAAWCKEGQVVVLFETTGERKTIPIPLHSTCGGIAISSDGNTLAVWTGNRISLVSISSGEIQQLAGHNEAVARAVFSPDGSLLASTTGSTEVFLWQVSPIKNLYQMYANYVDTLDFSPDSKILTGFGRSSISYTWNTKNGAETRSPVFGQTAAFSLNRDLVVTGFYDANLAIWNIPSGEMVSTFKGHEYILYKGTNITSIYSLPDGTGFITIGADGLIKLWGIR